MPKRVDPNESFMVERREKAQKWMAENGKKYKLTSRQQALDINNNMNNYYVPAPWKAYNKHKLCNQLFGVQLEWLQELLEIQGYTGKLSIDSGGSRSGSDSSSSDSSGDENDDGEGGSAPGGAGRTKRSQKLAGRKHKSDTVLQKDESKKSGGTSGQGSGEGSGNGPAEPKPLMITPDQLQALQTPGASLIFKPGVGLVATQQISQGLPQPAFVQRGVSAMMGVVPVHTTPPQAPPPALVSAPVQSAQPPAPSLAPPRIQGKDQPPALFPDTCTNNTCVSATGVDGSTQTGTSTTVDAGTQTEVDVIYITDLAKYFHDIADKLGAGASLYSVQETFEEKKKLEDELKVLKDKNAEQQKFIGALKTTISQFS